MASARAEGDEHALAEGLLQLCHATPLFVDNLADVDEWITEARDLAVRAVLPKEHEIGLLLRSAEVFLARGVPRGAFEVATEACKLANRETLIRLEDQAWMVEARALVRIGQQDDALSLFDRIVGREIPPELEDPSVPGLAFLAVGEAHLFEGRYDGAYQPLETAVGMLPDAASADRLRYDALVGLGMLDHRLGAFEQAGHRYGAAMALADKHSSGTEQVESLLLMGSLCRGLGDAKTAAQHLDRALKLSASLNPPVQKVNFPTERLRNLVGRATAEDMSDTAVELAGDCGAAGDLMGYVQLTAIVAALTERVSGIADARLMLQNVAAGLDASGHPEAGSVVTKHLQGYGGAS